MAQRRYPPPGYPWPGQPHPAGPNVGPRGRGVGETGALGVGVFGSPKDLDRISRGKMVRVMSDSPPLSPIKEGAFIPRDGQPIGVMQVTQVDPGVRSQDDQHLFSPGEIHLLTVQIDREKIQSSLNCDLRCRIRWGVGGARDFLICDWADGGLISIVADELWVDAIPYATTDDLPFEAQGFERLISACVGIGGNDAIPPQFTTPIRTLAPGAIQTISPTPAYARAVSLVAHYAPGAANPLADPYPDLTLELFSALPAQDYAMYIGPTIVGGAAVPISGADGVRIRNTSAVDSISLRAVFHLGV